MNSSSSCNCKSAPRVVDDPNKLKLNDEETKVLIIISNGLIQISAKDFELIYSQLFVVGNSTVCLSPSAKSLGVTFDMHLTIAALVEL